MHPSFALLHPNNVISRHNRDEGTVIRALHHDTCQAAFQPVCVSKAVAEHIIVRQSRQLLPPILQRGRAAEVLQAGITAFPEDGRLHRRLGGLLLAQNRTEEAIAILKRAQELEPMMSDTYGMLGELWTHQGTHAWADAEASIDEALRLAPEDAQHLSRKADLLRRKALVEADDAARGALLEQSEELLRQALQLDQLVHAFLRNSPIALPAGELEPMLAVLRGAYSEGLAGTMLAMAALTGLLLALSLLLLIIGRQQQLLVQQDT